jgi:uncharacterized protein YkwD
MKKLLLPVLFVGGVLGVTCYAQNQSASDIVALTQYRVALDQIAAGKPDNARLLLEAGMQQGETGPETAALLAYLQEKAGDTKQASQTLQGVATPTGFTTAFLSRLSGAPTAVEVAGTTQRPANPARLESTDARIAKLEKLMWQIVNDERQSKNLPALAWNDDMASVSRAHSAEMRDKKYFAHESPTVRLKDPLDRYVVGIGHTPRLVAENVYRAWGGRSFLTDNDIRDAHASLMKSPGHRANILIDGATKMGIGITANASGDIWITQMFAKDRQ